MGAHYGSSGLATTSDLSTQCLTGADAGRDETCRFVAVRNNLSEYWTSAVPGLRLPTTPLFEQGVRTGCGRASSALGTGLSGGDARECDTRSVPEV